LGVENLLVLLPSLLLAPLIALGCSPLNTKDVVRWVMISLAYLTDQQWNPFPRPNIVDETRAKLVDDLTRHALTF
jgi:hypothetical protein